MSCINCDNSAEHYMYSEEHGCDIMYRTCVLKGDIPVDDDCTCVDDTRPPKNNSAMKQVVVQYQSSIKTYRNVTKVQFFKEKNFYDSYIVIVQGEERTLIMLSEMNGGFEVIEK